MFVHSAGGARFPLEPQRIEIDFADEATPGALRFKLPPSGPPIAPTIRFYYSGSGSDPLRRVVLSLFEGGPGGQTLALDPSDSEESVRVVGTDPAASFLRTTTGEVVWLSPISRQSQYVAQLDPVEGNGYFTLAGPWLPSIRTSEGWRRLTLNDRLLCGLSGSEYLVLDDGGALTFEPGQPAYSAWTGAGEPAPWPMPRLSATLPDRITPSTTSWISTAAGSAYASQPSEAIYYSSLNGGSGSAALGDAGLLMGPAATATAAAIFPLAPYGGLDASLTTDLSDCGDFELGVLGPTRYDLLASFAQANPPPRSPGSSIQAVTPQGLLLTAGVDLLSWSQLQLANGSAPILIESPQSVLRLALQSSQLCLVVSDPAQAAAACGSFQAAFGMAGWNFDFTPDKWLDGGDHPEHSTILIFKYHSRPLMELIRDPGLWTNPAGFNAQIGPARVATALQTICSEACRSSSTAYDYLCKTVLADKDWNGIIVFNCAAPTSELPPEIEGIAAGIDASAFYAHHVGINASAILPGESLGQGPSDLFGLIDYHDPSHPAPAPGEDYAFSVAYLQVLFRKSKIASFGSQIELYVGKLFGDSGQFVADGPSSPSPIMTLNGVYQDHGGVGSYSFATNGQELFVFTSNSLLVDLTIDQSQFVTVVQSSRADPTQVRSSFLFWGSLRFRDLDAAFPGLGCYDLLSFGPRPSDAGSTRSRLAFSNLALSMKFTPVQSGEPKQTFFFDASTLAINPGSTLARPTSLYSGMGSTVSGMIQGFLPEGAVQTAASLNFLPLDLPFSTEPLATEWYGLRLAADLGSQGAFGPPGGMSGGLLIAWSPEGGDGALPQVFAGIQLPGGSNNQVPLQGVASLDFPAIRLAGEAPPSGEVSGAAADMPWRYSLAMDLANFRLLSETFPIGAVAVYAYYDSDTSSRVWYGVFNQGYSFPEVPNVDNSSGGASFVAPFVLDLLAIGQNVTVDLGSSTSVDDIVAVLQGTLKPVSDPSQKLPEGVAATSGNQWLIALKFMIADTVTVTFLFNDPTLAGGSIALSGPAAKSLDGLSLEVLYSKISDTIGHWHAQITFPTIGGPDDEDPPATKFKAPKLVAPHEGLEFTIPSLTVDVFTNGEFKVNVGFPDGTDFSNSLMAKIGGIVGRGGFYFGKLSSATATSVPAIANGKFQPVIEVGVAIAAGRYWDADAGVLKGSAEIDFLFMFQGVFATFLPTDTTQPNDHYVMVNVAAGLQIIITGELNFGIISASLTAQVNATLSFQIVSYGAVTITAAITISFECSIKILFIRISFSFSTEFHYTFDLTSGGTPPWTIETDDSGLTLPGRLRMQRLPNARNPQRWGGYLNVEAERRLYTAAMVRPPQLYAAPLWLNLVALPAVTAASPTYLKPHDGSPSPAAPILLAAMQLSIENAVSPGSLGVNDIKNRRHVRPGAATDAEGNLAPFDQLAQAVLQWMIGIHAGPSSDWIDAAALRQLLDELSDPGNVGTVFSLQNLYDFLKQNFRLNLLPVLDGAPNIEGTPFPLGPLFTCEPQPSPGPRADPVLPPEYAAMVQAYFAQMTDSMPAPAPADADAAAAPAMTLSQMQFVSYFTLLAKGAVSNALTLLKAFPYTVGPGTPSLAAVATQFDVYPLDLVTALATGEDPTLSAGAPIQLTTVNYQIKSGDTLGGIAAAFAELGYGDGTAIAEANLDTAILAPGLALALTPATLIAEAGDSAQSIAALLLTRNGATAKVDDPALARRQLRAQIIEVNQSVPSFASLVPGSTLSIPTSGSAVTYTVRSGDTLDLVAGYFLILNNAAWPDAGALAAKIAALNPKGLTPGGPVAAPALQHVVTSGETINSAAALLFANAAAIVSAILTQPVLLPGGVLSFPSVTLSAPAGTKLSALASRYNLSMADLSAAVCDVENLLPPGSAVTISHANRVQVDLLLTTLASANPQTNYNNVAGLVARFMLHGDRVPDPADPKFSVMSPQEILDSNEIFDTFAVTDLLGLQVRLAPDATSIDVTLRRAIQEPWVVLGGDPGLDSLEASLPLAGVLPDPAAPVASNVAAMPPAQTVPLCFDLQQVVHWQTADWSFIPASQKPPGAGEPTIWMFPLGLIEYQQGSGGVLALATSPRQADTNLTYRFASRIQFRVRQIGGASPLSNTYMLIGAGQNDRALLEAMFTSLDGGTALPLFLLYPPDPSGANPQGLSSDEIDRDRTSIQQTNLSTVTSENDPGATANGAALAQYSATAQPSDATAFLRLLWQCSVVGGGGFYLNYASATGQGLPSWLFASSAEAELSLLVVWEDQSEPGAVVEPYVNAMILADNLDPSAVRLSIQTGGTRTVATLPAGHAGFTITRPNPDSGDASTPATLTEQLYSLAGGSVLDAAGKVISRQFKPSGPIPPNGAATFAGDDWHYARSLPLYRVAPPSALPDSSALPAISEDPYAGVTQKTALRIVPVFQDLFGNRRGPTCDGDPAPQLAMPLTYSDDLIPVGEWPGIVANYRIGPSSSSGPAEPVVTVTLEMTSHNLVVGSTQGVTSVQEAAAQLAGKLNHVYYQASQPDVAFAAFANLDCDTPHPLPSCAVKDFVAACCVHTAAVGRQRQMIYAVPGSAVSLRDAASTIGVAPGDLLALNGTSAASALFDSGLTLPCYVASGPDDTLQTLADRARVTVEALVAQNSTLGAAAGARLTVSPSIATVPSPSGTLAALAAASAVSPAILAQANDTTAGLIVANMPLSMGAVGIVTGEGATFASLVLAFLEVGAPETITVADVAAAAANVEGLLAPGSKLTFSQCIAAKGSTLGELAASIPGFASLNAATPGVLGPGSRVLIGTSAADWPTIKDEKLLDIAATAAVSIQEVAAVNGDQALAPGATLAVPGLVSLTAGPGLFAPYTAVVGDTLANVCVKLGGAAPDLVGVINQNRPSILAVGERILPAVTPGVPPYTIVQGDTLRSIFSHYETLGIPTFEAFIESVAGLDNLLPPGAVVIGPVATATADSLAAIAAGTGVELSQIVAANAALQNFLKAGAQVSLPDPNDPAKPVTLTVGGWDSFNTLVARFAGRGIVTTAQDLARAYAAEPGMVTIGQAFLLPPKSLALSVTVQRSNPALVSPIIVTLEVSRDPTLAPGAPASAVTARSTLGGAAGANQSGALSFGGFAEEFESAYPGLKLATTKAGPSRLWWVDFGGTGITVAPSPGGVTAYALPPLSNRLMARTGVPIEPFVPAGEQ